jgi:hypothetical protein
MTHPWEVFLNQHPALYNCYLSASIQHMNYVPVHYFINYMDAHILMGKMQHEGIQCWLKDEHTVTVNPILAGVVGGIKLMVPEHQKEEAMRLLNRMEEERKSRQSCPRCRSHDIQFVSTPRRAGNWLTALASVFIGDYALTVHKTYHCFQCGNEFDKPVEHSEEEK